MQSLRANSCTLAALALGYELTHFAQDLLSCTMCYRTVAAPAVAPTCQCCAGDDQHEVQQAERPNCVTQKNDQNIGNGMPAALLQQSTRTGEAGKRW